MAAPGENVSHAWGASQNAIKFHLKAVFLLYITEIIR